jgi:hypothetical protein
LLCTRFWTFIWPLGHCGCFSPECWDWGSQCRGREFQRLSAGCRGGYCAGPVQTTAGRATLPQSPQSAASMFHTFFTLLTAVKPVNSTPLNSTRPVNRSMSCWTVCFSLWWCPSKQHIPANSTAFSLVPIIGAIRRFHCITIGLVRSRVAVVVATKKHGVIVLYNWNKMHNRKKKEENLLT